MAPARPSALIGKGVTFDTGGISIKPSAGMHEMKMDMSGAAAVIEAVAAIAELGLAIELIAVMPSTENMPSGTAIKPGDVITQYNGKTVEVNNTDAEGRLILADALAYAVELGAERVVDLATLTGAVLVALGSTYAAVISNDDDLAEAIFARPVESTGELIWRLPLHPEYKEMIKGTVADLTNVSAKRKAGTIYAGSFLEEFVGETSLGPHRHRRHRLGRRPRVHRLRRQRLRRPAPGRARPPTRRLATAQPPRIMQVEVPWASSLPLCAASGSPPRWPGAGRGEEPRRGRAPGRCRG